MKTLNLKPREGLLVRHPDGKHLASKGESVPDIPYWRRRLRDGDVEKTSKAAVAAPKKSSKPQDKGSEE